MRAFLSGMLAAAGLLGCFVGVGSAQSFGGRHDIPRVYGPGARSPYDEPFSHRYNYYSGPALYFNGDAREMWQQDYIDRLDRAERFGYPIPHPPVELSDPYYPRPRLFGGARFGIFRR
jgi:hypothetical protein